MNRYEYYVLLLIDFVIQGASWEPWLTSGNVPLGQNKKKVNKCISENRRPTLRSYKILSRKTRFYSFTCIWGGFGLEGQDIIDVLPLNKKYGFGNPL